MTRNERQGDDGWDSPIDVELEQDRHVFIAGEPERAHRIADALQHAAGTAEAAGLLPPPSGVQVFELRGPQALVTWPTVLNATRYRVLRDRSLLEPPVQGHGLYVDDTVRPRESYVYAVASEGVDGQLSALSAPVELAITPTSSETLEVVDVELKSVEPFDPSWTPDSGDPPWAGMRMEELLEGTPLGVAELLQRRGPIMAALAGHAQELQTTLEPKYPDRTFFSVNLAANDSLNVMGTPIVAKGLSEFVGDLGQMGAGLVFRIEG